MLSYFTHGTINSFESKPIFHWLPIIFIYTSQSIFNKGTSSVKGGFLLENRHVALLTTTILIVLPLGFKGSTWWLGVVLLLLVSCICHVCWNKYLCISGLNCHDSWILLLLLLLEGVHNCGIGLLKLLQNLHAVFGLGEFPRELRNSH